MSKEIINPNSIRANTPDWQEGYEQGVLSGYTKSIVLIRHFQRTAEVGSWQREILEEAMELIAKEIKPNNNDEFFSRGDDAREI